MKKLLAILFVLIVFVSSCTQTKQQTNDKKTDTSQQPPTLPLKSEIKNFNIEAKRWEFIPNTITVNEGDTVRIKIKSTDVTHGFGISGYNVNKVLNPGETVDVELLADQKGIFNFICTVPCGPGHSDMKGKLIVN